MKTPITKTLSASLLGTPIETNTLKKIVRQEKGKENADVNPKEASESKIRSNRLAHRPKTNLIMEEQATVLLMKRCGTLEKGQSMDASHHSKFREQFVGPLKKKIVVAFRETFGLTENAEEDSLGALALEGEGC